MKQDFDDEPNFLHILNHIIAELLNRQYIFKEVLYSSLPINGMKVVESYKVCIGQQKQVCKISTSTNCWDMLQHKLKLHQMQQVFG